MKTLRSVLASDPLAKFLMTRLRFSPIRVSIFIMVVAFVYDVLQFLLFGTTPSDSLEIITILAWHYVFIPAMGFFYLWSNNALSDLLNDLAKANTIKLSPTEIDSYMRFFHTPVRFLLAMMGGIALGLLYLARSTSFDSTYTNPIFLVPRQVSWFLAGYIVTMLSSTLVVNVLIINNVFKNRSIHLEPMHPDKSGGLGKLGDYSKIIAYLISSAGLVIGLTELRYFSGAFPKDLWIIHISVPIYIVGATVSFFAPIILVHRKMKETKRRLLIELQEKIAQEYYASKEKIVRHSENIDTDISRIKQLQTLYELTEKIPEWPFSSPALNGYLFSIMSPLFSWVFGLLVDYIKEAILQ